MKCSLIQEKLSCYLDGVLDEATLEAVELHLEGCATCRRELELLRALTQAVGEIEEVEAPAGLTAAIHDAIAAEQAIAAPCREFEVALSAYIDGELATADAEAVCAHLEICPACAKEAAMLRRLSQAMSSVEEVEVPSDLRSRIVAATTGKPTFIEALRAGMRILTPIRLRVAAIGAAAAASVITYFAINAPVPPKENSTPRQVVSAVEEKAPRARETAKAAPKEEVRKTLPVEKPRVQIASVRPSIRLKRAASRAVHPVKVKESIKETPSAKPVEKHEDVPDIDGRARMASTSEPTPAAPGVEGAKESAETASAVTEAAPIPGPIRIRVAATDISSPERFERIINEIKLEAERRRSPEERARLDLIRINR